MVAARLRSDERPGEVLEVTVLSAWRDRLRGLLGTDEDAPAVLLTLCSSIHTFGMRYPLDVAFIGERGEVLLVKRGLSPGRGASHPRARCVVERPACEGGWLEEGEHLWACSISADGVGVL